MVLAGSERRLPDLLSIGMMMMMMMSRAASSNHQLLQSSAWLPISCSHQKNGRRREGWQALSFVELPEFNASSVLQLLLPPPALLSRAQIICPPAAAVLSASRSHVRPITCSRRWTCSVEGMPVPRAAIVDCYLRSSARVSTGHLRRPASTNESLPFICMPYS